MDKKTHKLRSKDNGSKEQSSDFYLERTVARRRSKNKASIQKSPDPDKRNYHDKKVSGITKWWNTISPTVRGAIVGGFFAVVAGVAAEFVPILIKADPPVAVVETESPIFEVTNESQHPDSSIYIEVKNGITVLEKRLDVELDGQKAFGVAEIIRDSESPQWHFIPSNVSDFTEESLNTGWHEIRIGMSGQNLSSAQRIYFAIPSTFQSSSKDSTETQ